MGNDGIEPLHDWYFSEDTSLTEARHGSGGGERFGHSGTGGGFKISSASAR